MDAEIDPRSLIGHRAVDSSGQKIGTVDEVYLDDATGAPQWAAVRTGLFGHDALVPLGTSEFADGRLEVAFDKGTVKSAPDLGAGRHLSPEQERRLYRHYGIGVEEPAAPEPDREFGSVAGPEAPDAEAPDPVDRDAQ